MMLQGVGRSFTFTQSKVPTFPLAFPLAFWLLLAIVLLGFWNGFDAKTL